MSNETDLKALDAFRPFITFEVLDKLSGTMLDIGGKVGVHTDQINKILSILTIVMDKLNIEDPSITL